LGISQGAAVAIAYTVAHPERVSRLVLFGSYTRGLLASSSPELQERARLVLDLAKVGWGTRSAPFRQVFTSAFLPGGTPEQWRAFDELQRTTTTTANALRFLESFFRLDVTDLAPQVTAPTLILHSTRDQVWPFALGRDLATRIPGSQFVPLSSDNHLLLESEPAWPQFLDAVERFLAR
jgi:pimeloyl-ACP methyl ester carboxylesterase